MEPWNKQTNNKQNPFSFAYRTRGLMSLSGTGGEEVRGDPGAESGEGATWGVLQVQRRLGQWGQSGQETRAELRLLPFGGYAGSAFCPPGQLESREAKRRDSSPRVGREMNEELESTVSWNSSCFTKSRASSPTFLSSSGRYLKWIVWGKEPNNFFPSILHRSPPPLPPRAFKNLG